MQLEKVLEEARTVGLTDLTWEMAFLFPCQGHWTVDDYLLLPTNRLVELSGGRLEVLSMPSKTHQLIVHFLLNALKAFVKSGEGGTVLMAPFPVKLGPGKFREPDVVCVLARHQDRCGERFAEGADLVMEIVSASDPARDRGTKRLEYAQGGIPEYWIVDPQEARITVLKLSIDGYAVHGEFVRGMRATSALLPGFEVDVNRALDAE
jgi:Uma2 family endonuclease